MSPSESSQVVGDPARRRRVRLAVAFLATAAVVVAIGWMWVASFAPASFSVAQMGTPDYGGGAAPSHGHGPGAARGGSTGRDVRTLVEPDAGRAPDVALTLTARAGQV
ncbi:MAG TPA: hypothetical protein VFM86_06790, partial [Pedococcus sp.]|nr:hypothetical protein [Pedococcus sp.]